MLFSLNCWSQSFLEEFEEKISNSKDYSLEVLELFPEGKLDYKATEEIRTVRKQFEHLIEHMLWLSSSYLSKEQKEIEGSSLKKMNKQQIKDELSIAFDYVLKITKAFNESHLNEKVDFFAGEKSKRKMFVLINDHITHHRAQLLIYLRLNNIKPPSYRGW